MDVKTVFLNDDIDKYIYISQLPNYESDDSKQMVCKLKKSIYALK
jgi:Reverse transcriptase (RNA-dependent DNA polymerase)